MLTPPRSWSDPREHALRGAHADWYKLCTRLIVSLLRTTHDFYRPLDVQPVLMPITVSSVSSPMGLGSDSLPVSVELHGSRTYLADSMQFQLEFMLRHNMHGAYYVMPTFRGEDPDASHLNQFFHAEAEIRGDLADVMHVVERYVAALAGAILRDPMIDDVEAAAGGVEHIGALASATQLPAITFDEAVGRLGTPAFRDLGSGRLAIRRGAEQELIAQFGGAVWLTRPPHVSVPFYQAFAEDPAKALAADLLCGIGEVVGCGQRHTDAAALRRALHLHAVDEREYEWYVLMKEHHPLLTSGFGLGIERFLLFVLRHDDIRDLHVMPRLKGHSSWL